MTDNKPTLSLPKRFAPAARALTLLGLGAAIAVTGYNQLLQKERELLFRIVPGTASWFNGLPEGVVEANLPVPGAEKTEHLHSWWWPAARPDAPALLYLHGARWNLTGQAFRIEQLHAFGFSVLAIDYRGFGQSDGDLPSEKTVYQDAHVAWEHLAKLEPDPGKRYIYGHSLGGAIAIDLAASLSAAADKSAGAAVSTIAAHGLIVESSFTSLVDIAKFLSHPMLPMKLLLSQKFDSIRKIAQVDMPVLIVHGTHDRYVPSHFSERLYAAAGHGGHRKRLLLVDGGNHNDSMRVGESDYRQAFREVFGWTPDRV
ncbi:alpha/beta hydrolase [soil metagenome]